MRRLSQVLVFLGLMLWPMETHAQSEELTEAIEQAEKLYQAGRFQEAAPFLEKAISLSEREFRPDDPRIAELLNDLGDVYISLCSPAPLFFSNICLNHAWH